MRDSWPETISVRALAQPAEAGKMAPPRIPTMKRPRSMPALISERPAARSVSGKTDSPSARAGRRQHAPVLGAAQHPAGLAIRPATAGGKRRKKVAIPDDHDVTFGEAAIQQRLLDPQEGYFVKSPKASSAPTSSSRTSSCSPRSSRGCWRTSSNAPRRRSTGSTRSAWVVLSGSMGCGETPATGRPCRFRESRDRRWLRPRRVHVRSRSPRR